jgi:transcriptional regulator with XRE-family HTH domain
MGIDLSTAERRRMGDRLRAARYAADLPIRAVAVEVGMSYTAVAAWERNGYLPPEHARVTLARLYGLPEVALFAEYHARRAEVLAPLADTDTHRRGGRRPAASAG